MNILLLSGYLAFYWLLRFQDKLSVLTGHARGWKIEFHDINLQIVILYENC